MSRTLDELLKSLPRRQRVAAERRAEELISEVVRLKTGTPPYAPSPQSAGARRMHNDVRRQHSYLPLLALNNYL